MANLREGSRQDWLHTGPVEHTNAGSLQRIADATEKIAINYDSLLRAKQSAEEGRDYWRGRADKLERRISALKGVITRLKRKENETPC